MLAKNSAIVFSALFANSVSAFLFLVLMGRTMTLGDFGQLNAFLSIQTIFSVPVGGLILLYSFHSAVFHASGQHGELRRLYRNAWEVCSASAAVSAVFIVAVMVLGGRDNAAGLSAAAAIAVLVAVYFVQAAQLAFVRGLQRFGMMAAGMTSAGVIKLSAGAALAWAGMVTVPSAVAAIAIGVVISIAVMHAALARRLGKVAEIRTGLDPVRMFRYVMVAVAGTVFPMFFMNVDMLMVRALFSGGISGHYGAFMVAGKAVFLFGQVVGMALFPAVVAADVSDRAAGDRLARRAMYILIGSGAVLVAGLSLFSGAVMRAILKSYDPAMAALLPYYGLAILAVAVLFLEANHRLARREYGFLWASGCAALLQVAGIAYFSDSIGAIVKFQAGLFWCVAVFRLRILFMEGRKEPAAVLDPT